MLPARFLDRPELEEDHVKIAVGQTWRMHMPEPDNEAYFLVTRFSDLNRGWMAVCLSLGVGWLPLKDGDEMLFHIDDEVTASFLELVSDASALTSEA